MIIVDYIDDKLVLSFKYYKHTIERLKSMSAKFNPDNKTWELPIGKLNEFKKVFKGETFFRTPIWEIECTAPPDYSKLYSFDVDVDIDNIGFKLLPYKYQEFGIKFHIDRLIKYNMSFVADSVGLGKTIQAIGVMKYFYNKSDIKKTVIVCKKSIKKQWKNEINKFIDFDGDIYIIGKETPKKRKKIYDEINNNTNNTILITNYHTLIKDFENYNCDMVVFDEVHTAKKYKGVINTACSKVAQNSEHCLFLTGTPVMNNPEDIYGIVSIKDPNYFGDYKTFSKTHVIKEMYKGEWKSVAYKNLDILRDKVQNIILRRTENEVKMDLPKVLPPKEIFCDLDSVQKKCLEKASETQFKITTQKDKLLKYVKENKDDEKAKEKLNILRGREKGQIAIEQIIANSPFLFNYSKSIGIKKSYEDLTPGPDYLSSKVETFLDIINEILESGEKAIVFTKYETVVRYLYSLLKKKTILSCPYTGKMKEDARDRSVELFTTTNTHNVFIGTEAAAEGLNLQASNHVIIFDSPYNDSMITQMIGRARRAGSKYSNVHVYKLITVGSIDENLKERVEFTKNSFDTLVSVNKAQSDLLYKLNN